MNISLRSGSRIYINGALLRVDRKVGIELINDAVFLLEAHILDAEQADTPLKQLYYTIQSILMQPTREDDLLRICQSVLPAVRQESKKQDVVTALGEVEVSIGNKRYIEALKRTRALFPVEE